MIQSNNDDINKANKLLKNHFSFSDAFIIKKNVFKYLTWKYWTEIILIWLNHLKNILRLIYKYYSIPK